mgnify:CR=1 FL=1
MCFYKLKVVNIVKIRVFDLKNFFKFYKLFIKLNKSLNFKDEFGLSTNSLSVFNEHNSNDLEDLIMYGLEINKNEDETSSTIYGLFGPNPTVWTMFMFFHFVVIGLFFGFGVCASTNWSLGNDFTIQLFITLFMIVIWFALYFGGSLGKQSGMAEMHLLHHFMRDTLRSKGIHTEH